MVQFHGGNIIWAVGQGTTRTSLIIWAVGQIEKCEKYWKITRNGILQNSQKCGKMWEN